MKHLKNGLFCHPWGGRGLVGCGPGGAWHSPGSALWAGRRAQRCPPPAGSGSTPSSALHTQLCPSAGGGRTPGCLQWERTNVGLWEARWAGGWQCAAWSPQPEAPCRQETLTLPSCPPRRWPCLLFHRLDPVLSSGSCPQFQSLSTQSGHSLFFCALQILFLPTESLWHSCVKQIYRCHFPHSICSLHVSIRFW